MNQKFCEKSMLSLYKINSTIKTKSIRFRTKTSKEEVRRNDLYVVFNKGSIEFLTSFSLILR